MHLRCLEAPHIAPDRLYKTELICQQTCSCCQKQLSFLCYLTNSRLIVMCLLLKVASVPATIKAWLMQCCWAHPSSTFSRLSEALLLGPSASGSPPWPRPFFHINSRKSPSGSRFLPSLSDGGQCSPGNPQSFRSGLDIHILWTRKRIMQFQVCVDFTSSWFPASPPLEPHWHIWCETLWSGHGVKTVRATLCTAPALKASGSSSPFALTVDGCDVVVRAVLPEAVYNSYKRHWILVREAKQTSTSIFNHWINQKLELQSFPHYRLTSIWKYSICFPTVTQINIYHKLSCELKKILSIMASNNT